MHILEQIGNQVDMEFDEACWQAVLAKDKSQIGQFYFGVKTTGVFCSPGCPARMPLRKNLEFFHTIEAARLAGFRPCKRCRPEQIDAHIKLIANACRVLETAETPPSLNELAEQANMSPFHFQRVFKKRVGISPKAYSKAIQTQRMREGLTQETRVTDVIYDSGYQASSRFYEDAQSHLNMAPRVFQKGGRGERIQWAVRACPLGWALVAATERGVCWISLGDDPDQLQTEFEAALPYADRQSTQDTFQTWLNAVFAVLEQGQAPDPSLPLDIQGTAFQRLVWQALQRIPLGETATYSEIAAKIGKPKSARAVAQACSQNRLAVIVPCHRVIRANGEVSGYRWGVKRKKKLLDRESTHAANPVD